MFLYVVGYNAKELRDGGQMISASFLGVGNEGYYVSDLVVSGYEENTQMLEDMEDMMIYFYLLTPGGQTLKQKDKYFYYLDFTEDCETWTGGVWHDYQDNPIEYVGAENDYILKPGDAIWLTTQGVPDGFVYSITTKGGVLSNSYQYELRDGGDGIGNPKANPVWVSEIAVTGYEENTQMLEDMEDMMIYFYILTPGGQTLKQKDKYFYYLDFTEDCETWTGGVWYDYQDNPIKNHGATNDFQLGLGQGIWLTTQGVPDGFSYYLVFP